ncbi:hypothetical protein ITX54_11700 [Rouxiella silvae]|jgi:hypothetical protein|uniref:Uncharacterized protein n=1 Tax=Rouxiella silvae TaxID=1646373 RepID=A0AA41BWK7_9GAMM|nr:hypothetical protein [Rouxiella silvae]KQN52209.1 hypothetical protein ASE93_03435 [Serratia sp. Leaf50]MBF6637320.1 hypothetical protein [Rouxiella silvae]
MPEQSNEETLNAHCQQLFALVETLKIDPLVPENQVLDRVALSFRKLLNFMAQHQEINACALLTSASSPLARARLAELMQENFLAAQLGGVFRQDIPAALLAQFFTGMLLQLAQHAGDAATRHQQSLAASKLFCEGAWMGAERA